MEYLAERHMVYGDLDISNIRLPFDKTVRRDFTRFDSRQRYICIMKELESEIDFDRYLQAGIIEDHYPLHKTKSTQEIVESVDKYWMSLFISLL
jgi:hypothetical protein